jgi:hypothetical protein
VEPKPADSGCDEVACVLAETPMPCCSKFRKSSGGGGSDDVKPSGSEVQDTLDRDQIAEAIDRSKGAIAACGEEFPDAPAQVRVKVRVSGSGSVSSVDAIDETDAAVVGCIASAIKKTRFPTTTKGGSFTFPAILR